MGVHRYSIAPKDPTAHLFELVVHVVTPDATGQSIAFPAWIPGSYLIRDLARHVVSIRATTEGSDVELTKTGSNAWVAGLCAGPLTITAEIYAFDHSARGAYLDSSRGFFDGASVFPAVVGQEALPCELDIRASAETLASGWRVATSMRSNGAANFDFGAYQAENYADLIDHPVEMGDFRVGEFSVNGIPHTIAVNGETKFDMARVCRDLGTLCAEQMSFLGKPTDLDRYLFLLNVRENGYGGLEHAWSSSLTCSRKDLPQLSNTATSDGYRKFLGLCSHEYFHLWNVKRLRPERFVPYQLERESHTGLLWVFEGITSYYDDLLLLRSGLISVESYLELLGKTVTRVQRARGRLLQSLEESSYDAWTKLYKPNENSSNAGISYYTKGSLVALALDLTIRQEGNGQYSLDDVMRECWRLYGQSGKGMPECGIEAIAEAVTGLSLGDFFERYVRGTVEPTLTKRLLTVRVRQHFRVACSATDTGGRPAKGENVSQPWIGAALRQKNGVQQFSLIHSGSPAENAGVAPGDEAVALDGLRINANNITDRLREHEIGDTVNLTVFRDHALKQYRITLGKAPEAVCYLTLDSAADDTCESARESWLSSTSFLSGIGRPGQSGPGI